MKLVKNVFLFGLIIIVVLFGISFANSKGLLKNTPLEQININELDLFSQENIKQTQVLSDRAKETSAHIQQILGDKIEVDEQSHEDQKEKAIHEKTVEYVRYLYCKQVVEDWEANH